MNSSALRPRPLRRTFASAALVTGLVGAAAGTASAQFDPAAEAINGAYRRMHLTGLHLDCGSNGDCAQVFGAATAARFPAVPGTGDTVRSIIPRPSARGTGTIDHLDLEVVDSEMAFQLADIGIGYNIGFTLRASRVGDGLVRFEGFTPQPDYCVIIGIPDPVGVKVLRFEGAGANVCATVSQDGAPDDDDDGLRHYKSFAMTSDARCAPTDPTLRAKSPRHRMGQNFFAVDYRLNNPSMADHADFLVKLGEAIEAVRAENQQRTEVCATFTAEERATEAACRLRPLPTWDTFAFELRPTQCAAYAGLGDARQLEGNFDAFSGTMARLPASAKASFPGARTTVELDATHICRYVDGSAVPSRTITGRVTINQPLGVARTADEAYELGQLSRGIDYTLAARYERDPVSGVTFTPARNRVELRQGTSIRLPFSMRLDAIGGAPGFTGTLSVDARGPLVADARPSMLGVIGTVKNNLCLELDPVMTDLWQDPGFFLPLSMPDPAPDAFLELARDLTVELRWLEKNLIP